eukprot:scaffold1931_cov215-Ochromonas_danica.AAC.5
MPINILTLFRQALSGSLDFVAPVDLQTVLMSSGCSENELHTIEAEFLKADTQSEDTDGQSSESTLPIEGFPIRKLIRRIGSLTLRVNLFRALQNSFSNETTSKSLVGHDPQGLFSTLSQGEDSEGFHFLTRPLSYPEMSQQSHATSFIPSQSTLTGLPPLRMQKSLSSKFTRPPIKKLTISEGEFDESFTRETPRVLHYSNYDSPHDPFAEVTALRRELQVSKAGFNQLTKLVDQNIAWVQQNCDMSQWAQHISSRAKRKCKNMAADRIGNVFTRYLHMTLQWTMKRWKVAILEDKCTIMVNNYCRSKAIVLFVHQFYTRHFQSLHRRLKVWFELVREQRYRERVAACVEIQRVMRGRLGRLRFAHIKLGLVAIQIQCFFRRLHAKFVVSRKRDELARKILYQKQSNAALVIQKRMKSFLLIIKAKAELNRRRTRVAATKIQKIFRGQQGRERYLRVQKEMRDYQETMKQHFNDLDALAEKGQLDLRNLEKEVNTSDKTLLDNRLGSVLKNDATNRPRNGSQNSKANATRRSQKTVVAVRKIDGNSNKVSSSKRSSAVTSKVVPSSTKRSKIAVGKEVKKTITMPKDSTLRDEASSIAENVAVMETTTHEAFAESKGAEDAKGVDCKPPHGEESEVNSLAVDENPPIIEHESKSELLSEPINADELEANKDEFRGNETHEYLPASRGRKEITEETLKKSDSIDLCDQVESGRSLPPREVASSHSPSSRESQAPSSSHKGSLFGLNIPSLPVSIKTSGLFSNPFTSWSKSKSDSSSPAKDHAQLSAAIVVEPHSDVSIRKELSREAEDWNSAQKAIPLEPSFKLTDQTLETNMNYQLHSSESVSTRAAVFPKDVSNAPRSPARPSTCQDEQEILENSLNSQIAHLKVESGDHLNDHSAHTSEVNVGTAVENSVVVDNYPASTSSGRNSEHDVTISPEQNAVADNDAIIPFERDFHQSSKLIVESEGDRRLHSAETANHGQTEKLLEEEGELEQTGDFAISSGHDVVEDKTIIRESNNEASLEKKPIVLMNTAAVKLQSMVRIYFAKRAAKLKRAEVERSQLEAEQIIDWATVTIQKSARGKLARERTKNLRVLRSEEERRKKEKSAVAIQSGMRGMHARKRVRTVKAKKEEERNHMEWLKSFDKTAPRPAKNDEIIANHPGPVENDEKGLTSSEAVDNLSSLNDPEQLSRTLTPKTPVEQLSPKRDKSSPEEKNPSRPVSARQEQMSNSIEVIAKDPRLDNLEERLKQLEDIERRIKASEQNMAEEAKRAEERIRQQMQILEEKAKQAEAERQAREELMKLAVGSISHRSPFTTMGPHSARIMQSNGGGGLMSTRGSAPPTARSARSGPLPTDAPRLLYGGQEWVQLWDDEQQAYYWWCAATEVAQWEQPGMEQYYQQSSYNAQATHPATVVEGKDGEESGYESGGGALTDYSTDHEASYYTDSEGGGDYNDWQEYWDEQAQAKYWVKRPGLDPSISTRKTVPERSLLELSLTKEISRLNRAKIPMAGFPTLMKKLANYIGTM